MAITTLAQMIAAPKQGFFYRKSAARTGVGTVATSLMGLAGTPSAGALAAGNTANGVVPVDTDSGYVPLGTFGVGNTGYISSITFANSSSSILTLYDRIFLAGSYSFNANVTLASQPSYSGRVPNTDYKGLEIWVECVTATTGNLEVEVTYLNENGSLSTTGPFGTGSTWVLGRLLQLPLAPGDSGVSQIVSVTGTVASAGTFNVSVMRPLVKGMRILTVDVPQTWDFMKTGMPIIYEHSALYVTSGADSTNSGNSLAIHIEIANG